MERTWKCLPVFAKATAFPGIVSTCGSTWLPSEREKSYPVLYLLDGQWTFKLLASIYFGLRHGMFVPEMIIVGITYGGESPDYERLRAMDYTPTQAEGMEHTGDGPKFLAFLKKELIPFVEKNYRADSGDRVLGGSSFGGLFVMYTLFHEPEFFHRYISTSPSLAWDDKVTFRYEQAFAERNRKLTVKLFLSVGELEMKLRMVEPMKQMAQILEEPEYEGLVLTSMVISGERHAGQFAWQCKGGASTRQEPCKSEGGLPNVYEQGPAWSMGDSGAGLHQFQYLRLDLIGQIIPRRDHLIEIRIL